MLKPVLLKPWLLAAVMLLAAAGGEWLRPAELDLSAPPPSLTQLIPENLPGWRSDERLAMVRPDPEVMQKLGQLYSATQERAYLDDNGYRIMVSLAYGRRQTDTLRAHLPEICYTAQGFQVEALARDRLTAGAAYPQLPVTRMLARNGQRIEPVTYWLNLGGEVVSTPLQRKLTSLAFGLRGAVPDGMLVRVSSIDVDPHRAYAQQDRFVRVLLATLDEPRRRQLAGAPEAALAAGG